jgi:nucleoside-diphosphate kinase
VNRTLVIVKPDAVARGLVGEIVGRLEAKQLRVVQAQMRMIDRDTAARHYAEHVGRPYYEGLVEFITSGPALVMIVEGPDDAWRVVRSMMGTTNPLEAAPGTIRGDLARETQRNLIHGSDSPESAAREIDIFFPNQV